MARVVSESLLIATTQQLLRIVNPVFTKIWNFLFHYEYLDVEHLQGFAKYKYRGVDTNAFNNLLAMPFCDIVVKFIPTWLAPNVLTFATLLLSIAQYAVLCHYDYFIYASADELLYVERVPNWVWFFSGCCLLGCLLLDALDGKHARRIGACSPVGEILDHGIDTWRLMSPAITCFYSIFGRLQYGVPGYRLMWLMLSTQSLVTLMFVQQCATGILVYSWGYDIMQYMMAWFYFQTWYRRGAEYWQCDGWYFGTNAEITERWTHLIIFGVSFPMQIYYFIKHYRRDSIKQSLSLREFARPIFPIAALFTTALILSQRNLYDSFLEEDPRATLWLQGIIFCNILWRIMIAVVTETTCPRWNHLVTFFICFTVYSYVRPRSLLYWDTWVAQKAALLATLVHLHFVLCTLNQMCRHFGIYLFSLKSRHLSSQYRLA